MAKIKKAARPQAEIPTASMSDIAFLLLIFFIVSTVFVKGKVIKVALREQKVLTKYHVLMQLLYMLIVQVILLLMITLFKYPKLRM